MLGPVDAVFPMRSDHHNALLGQVGIELVGIIGLVADEALRFLVQEAGVKCLLNQFDLMWVRAVDGRRYRQSMSVHNYHDLAAFALLGFAYRSVTTLGRRKRPVDKA